jgi:hypothetical protein
MAQWKAAFMTLPMLQCFGLASKPKGESYVQLPVDMPSVSYGFATGQACPRQTDDDLGDGFTRAWEQRTVLAPTAGGETA